ncbi:MAG TPA: DUF5919 domain-containing protein [Streptosporangiaceae bacterium]|nr:DUF5919 domain-containing protein [Streptosporangiaceae bacterium]
MPVSPLSQHRLSAPLALPARHFVAAAQETPTNASPTLLAVLLEGRGLDRYGSFCAAYQRAAKIIEPGRGSSVPSRAQFHRWTTGGLRGLPYTDHCRVLEHMLTGYSAAQLLRPCPDRDVPAPARSNGHQRETAAPGPAVPVPPASMAGVEAVFASRSELAARIQPQSLLDGAPSVRAAGLSLNMICQQLPDQYLTRLLTAGTEMTCLFLDPAGEAITAREREEEHQPGALPALTRLNIDVLSRLRDRLPGPARDRLKIAVYEETIRCNILIAEGQACVVQPYLPLARGVDSPTLLIRPAAEPGSLYPVFGHVWDALAERSTPL